MSPVSSVNVHYHQQNTIMKRKLNEHDVPEEAISPPKPFASSAQSSNAAVTSFDDLGLDSRLLQAVAQEKYSVPTPVQAKAIPLALEGRDILGMYC